MQRGGLAGVPMMLAAMLAFASHDALAKTLLEDHPVGQLLLIGSIAGLLLVLPRLHRRGFRRVFVVPSLALHVLRGLLIAGEAALFYASVRLLPLGECLTIYQAMPLLAALLAVPLLGERIGWRAWMAILVGFGGVVLVLRPTASGIAWPALLALSGTAVYALANILTRHLRAAGDDVLIGWQSVVMVLACAVVAPFVWQPIGLGTAALAALLGIVTAAGNLLFNRALILSPASIVLPFHYSIIVWGMALGWLVWRDIPDLQMLAGATIVVASGVMMVRWGPSQE